MIQDKPKVVIHVYVWVPFMWRPSVPFMIMCCGVAEAGKDSFLLPRFTWSSIINVVPVSCVAVH